MFVDASAIVAILTEEDEAEKLAAALDAAAEAITSPVAVWEAPWRLHVRPGSALRPNCLISLLFSILRQSVSTPLTCQRLRLRVAAFDRYGRRSGHPADLNMGDCFAYAFAKLRRIPLLYKGKDFGFTDVQRYAEE